MTDSANSADADAVTEPHVHERSIKPRHNTYAPSRSAETFPHHNTAGTAVPANPNRAPISCPRGAHLGIYG
jgi:hypothetical protein